MKRTERLFALAEHLRGRRTGVTAEQLAERFGVTVRTMYRDLESLRVADLPLLAERGRGGGYALDRNYSLPPVNFTAQEAAVLLAVGHMVEAQRMLPFTRTLQGALDKVRGALPTPAQRESQQLLGSLQFVGVPARAASPQVARVLEQAWLERRPVRLRYQSRRGEVETTAEVSIHALVLDRLETLLNTKDRTTGEARQYRLHQVTHAELLPGSV